MVVDGLSMLLAYVNRSHRFQGLQVGRHEHISHILFLEDILILCLCGGLNGRVLKDILDIFCDSTIMVINIMKSPIYFFGLEVD
jgi:hypothetical protein